MLKFWATSSSLHKLAYHCILSFVVFITGKVKLSFSLNCLCSCSSCLKRHEPKRQWDLGWLGIHPNKDDKFLLKLNTGTRSVAKKLKRVEYEYEVVKTDWNYTSWTISFFFITGRISTKGFYKHSKGKWIILTISLAFLQGIEKVDLNCTPLNV